MMKFKTFSFLTSIGLLIMLFPLALPAQKEWQLVKSKDDIKVFKRDVNNSPLKELKVLATYQSSLAGFVAFIKDVPAQSLYMYSCMFSKVLKEVNEKELIFYQQIKAPWPFSNRDGVYHQLIEQDASTHIINIHTNAISDYIPKNNDFVRVPLMKSSWIVKANKNGTIDAEYYFYGDPGGSLPIWLINLFIAEAPFKTQVKIHELIKQKKYQDAKSTFISN